MFRDKTHESLQHRRGRHFRIRHYVDAELYLAVDNGNDGQFPKGHVFPYIGKEYEGYTLLLPGQLFGALHVVHFRADLGVRFLLRKCFRIASLAVDPSDWMISG